MNPTCLHSYFVCNLLVDYLRFTAHSKFFFIHNKIALFLFKLWRSFLGREILLLITFSQNIAPVPALWQGLTLYNGVPTVLILKDTRGSTQCPSD